MGLFGKLKASAKGKITEIKEDRQRTKEINQNAKRIEKDVYFTRLAQEKDLRAVEKGKRKAASKAQPKLVRAAGAARTVAKAMPAIRTDGPDPFGLFGSSTRQNQNTTHQRRKSSNRRGTTIIIQQRSSSYKRRTKHRKKTRSGSSYLDQLL